MKKKIVITLACLVVLISAVFGCGSSEDSSTSSSTSTSSDTSSEDVKEESKAETRAEESTEPEKTTEVGNETEDEPEFGSSVAGASLSIGTTKNYEYASDDVTGEFTITYEDAGIETVDNGYGGKVDVVYLVMEINNNMNTTLYLDDRDFAIYGDNYQMDVENNVSDGSLSVETGIYSTISIHVNEGRSGKFIFKSILPEGHEHISTIEIELVDVGDILVVKENGIWINDYMDYGYDGSIVDPYCIYGEQYKFDGDNIKLVIEEGEDKSYYGKITFGANQQAYHSGRLIRRDNTIIEEGEVILDVMIKQKVLGDYEKVGELHLYVYMESPTDLELILDDNVKSAAGTDYLAPIFNGSYNTWGSFS